MSDKKISQLTAATTPLDGTEVLPIVQSGATVKIANSDLRPKQIQSNATSGVLQIAGPAAAATRVMTTPDANFTVARTDAGQTFSGLQNFSFTGGNGPVVNRTDGAGYINFQSSGVNNAQIGEDGAGGFTLYTNMAVSAKQPMVWRADGDVRLQVGNLVPYVAGKGINFTSNTPASGMTSQLLNWYEEGTWTPTVKVDNAGSAVGITLYEGTYTRVGRLVFAEFRIARNDASALTGSVTWSLPIASGNATYFVSGSWWNATTNISGTVDINNYAASIANGGIAAGGYLTYANFANGDNLCVSMIYQA